MPIQLTQAQAVIASDLHRFRVLCCGRRFGKTTLAIDQIKGCAALRPGSRIAYIAPTFQQARDIAWQQLKKDCKDAAEFINETRLEIKLVNGSLIILRGWESIETLRGQQFDLIVIDEVASMRNFKLNWQEVVRPTLTDTKGEALFISTPKGFNHFYELFNEQEKDPDYKSFHFTTYDNTHIPREEVDKASAELGADRFAQEYLADFRKTEGLVYKEFDRDKNVISEQQLVDLKMRGLALVELLVGIDFGYTNPCAVLSVYRDRSDTYYLLKEFYERGKTDAEVAEYVVGLKAQRVYPDPESPAAIAELTKRKVNVREVIKGKDSIKNGIDRVREVLRAGKLFIHADCVNTIMEFETYVYPESKQDQNDDENPTDDNNHALDALRYVIMMSGGTTQTAQQYYPNHRIQSPTDTVRNIEVAASTMRRESKVHYPSFTRRGYSPQ